MTPLRLLPAPNSAGKENDKTKTTAEKKPVPYNPAMLAMGRTACGFTQSEFAEELKIPQARLSRLEDGLIPEVDAWVLEKASDVTGFPLDFFTQEGGQKPLREAFFRRRASISVKHLRRVEALINVKRMEVEKLLEKADMEPELPLPYWPPDQFSGGPRENARHLRVAWGVARGPIKDLTALIEAAGCLIVPFDFQSPKIDGVSTTTRDGQPLIFINTRVPAARFRCTLAHELGHVLMHRIPTPEMEQEAFDFAAEFMVPEEEIKSALFPLDLERLSRLKLKWGMSMQFFLSWARRLGKIKESYYKFLHMRLAQAGWKTVEPYDMETPVEKPTLLKKLVQWVRDECQYSVEELRHALKGNAKTFPFEYAI